MLKSHTVVAVVGALTLTVTTTQGSSLVQSAADAAPVVAPASSEQPAPADGTTCYGGAQANGMVGTAVTRGNFRLDGSLIQESATIFVGARIESGNAPVTISFASGARFRLATHSRVIVAPDHLALVSGTGELLESAGCEVRVRGLRVAAGPVPSSARVIVLSNEVVTVDTTSGQFRVYDEDRGLIANLESGGALNFFAPERGAATAFVRGCLEERDDRLVVTDELTKRRAEVLAASDGVLRSTLENEIGSRLDIAGSAKSAGTPQVPVLLRAAGLQRLGGCRNLLAAFWPWPALAAATGTAAVTTIVTRPDPNAPPVSP